MLYETLETERPQENSGSEGDLNRKETMLRRFRRCKKYYHDWREEADSDFKFALGDQWEETDRQALKNSGRPCLTFNRIRPIIDVISGYQRENEARIKVRPEGGEDEIFSDVVDRVLKYIDKVSKFTYKLGYLSDDGTITGKGFIEAIVSYDDDPVRGELDWRILSPRQVLVDPDCNEYDLNKGAEFIIKVCQYTRSKLKTMFPDKKDILDGIRMDDKEFEDITSEGDKDNYGNNPNKTTVVKSYTAGREDEQGGGEDDLLTLVEEWYKKYVEKFFVINRADDANEFESFENKAEAEAFIQQQGGGEIFARQVPQMWVSSMVNGELLRDAISPLEPYYSGFPFFRYMSKWSPSCDEERLKVQGIVRGLKDPQREKNKSHSQILHILNTQANTGWVGDETALTPAGWNELQKMGSQPNVIIKQKPGTNLREIQTKAPPVGQFNREQIAEEEFKQVSGLNPDLMGIQDKTASGRAISLRIKQAVMILVPQFQNYRYTKELIGKFILQMIPYLFEAKTGGIKKLKKILGGKYLAGQKNELYPEGLVDGVLMAFMAMIKDNKYDVEIAESDKSRTMRSEIFDQLVELAKTPAGQLIPPELLIDYMDISNANELKQAIGQQRQMMMSAVQPANKP